MNTLRDRDIDGERDLSDYRQPRSYDRDLDDGPDRGRSHNQDREISLGTGTILGIFFALALLCAVFFGFGYSMGRKSAQPGPATADAAPSTAFFGGSKPAPGSPIASALKSAVSAPSPASDGDSDSQPPQTASNTEDSSSAPKQAPAPPRVSTPADFEDAVTPVVVKAAAKPVSAPGASPTRASEVEPAMPQTTPNGTVMVQVAAVSHQEDADLLVSALKTRGYAVFIRQESQDHLLHVQVGPFAARKDADAMRKRLLADGYNAIVK